MELTEKIKEQVNKHALGEFPNECCGFIVKKCSKLKVFKCKNESPNPLNSFFISKENQPTKGEIIYYYHSHKENIEPSLLDIYVSEKKNIPCLITNGFEINIYSPKGMEIPYTGRPYLAGVFDCFTLIQDFYRRNFNLKIPDISNPHRYNIGEKINKETIREVEENNSLKKHFINNGFLEVKNDLRKGSIVLYSLKGMKNPIACGVCSKKNLLLFQDHNSSREEAVDFKKINCILRHESIG